MKQLLLLNFIFSSVLISCKQESVLDVPLKNLNGAEENLQPYMAGKKGMVLVFLAPDCPLSQYYTLPLRELSEKFNDQIAFAGIVPGTDSGKDEIMEYKKRYLIPFELLLDKELKLTRKLKATITPEVFLLNEKMAVVYSGAIDDAAVDLTVKRQLVRNHYLKDALEGMLNNRTISIQKTKAVGCIIERRK